MNFSLWNRRVECLPTRDPLASEHEMPARGASRMVTAWSLKGLALIVFVALPFGLSPLTTHMARSDDDPDARADPVAGVIVDYEITEIKVPQSLYDIAMRHYGSKLPENHAELRSTLELEHQQDLSYTLMFRFFTADGRGTILGYMKKPYSQPRHFSECQVVLSILTGNPTPLPTDRFATAEITLVPDESTDIPDAQEVNP